MPLTAAAFRTSVGTGVELDAAATIGFSTPMERASVEGQVFHRGAVAELTPDEMRPEVGAHLLALVRKELIRSTSPTLLTTRSTVAGCSRRLTRQ